MPRHQSPGPGSLSPVPDSDTFRRAAGPAAAQWSAEAIVSRTVTRHGSQ